MLSIAVAILILADKPTHPPSRIRDLRVTEIRYEARHVTLEWTATGTHLPGERGKKNIPLKYLEKCFVPCPFIVADFPILVLIFVWVILKAADKGIITTSTCNGISLQQT